MLDKIYFVLLAQFSSYAVFTKVYFVAAGENKKKLNKKFFIYEMSQTMPQEFESHLVSFNRSKCVGYISHEIQNDLSNSYI